MKAERPTCVQESQISHAGIAGRGGFRLIAFVAACLVFGVVVASPASAVPTGEFAESKRGGSERTSAEGGESVSIFAVKTGASNRIPGDRDSRIYRVRATVSAFGNVDGRDAARVNKIECQVASARGVRFPSEGRGRRAVRPQTQRRPSKRIGAGQVSIPTPKGPLAFPFPGFKVWEGTRPEISSVGFGESAHIFEWDWPDDKRTSQEVRFVAFLRGPAAQIPFQIRCNATFDGIFDKPLGVGFPDGRSATINGVTGGR